VRVCGRSTESGKKLPRQKSKMWKGANDDIGEYQSGSSDDSRSRVNREKLDGMSVREINYVVMTRL